VAHFHERSNCIQCHRTFCPHFASELDRNFCRVCLTTSEAVVEEKPLIDEEGIHHDGKWIMPAGSIYKTLPKAIADMSDGELDKYLEYMAGRLKDAERTAQYVRIAKSTADMEKSHRDILTARRLRGIKITPSGVKVNASGDGGKTIKPKATASDIANALKAAGVTPEMLAAILAAKKGVTK